MISLRDILYRAGIVNATAPLNGTVSGVSFDSRLVKENDLFVAVRGTLTDGHLFIGSAVEKGASAIVCEEIPGERKGDVTYIRVKNSAEALGAIAANFHNTPSEKLKLVGVTGTNGKTTVATLLYHLTMQLGYPAALLSTIENQVNGQAIPSTHTTPDPLQINGLLGRAVESGCEYCFMEVSSHALSQKRTHGLNFSGGIFTNITHDHLDYHSSFGEYLKAKQSFFDHLPASSFALTNIDDKNGKVMIQNSRARKYSYALQSPADFHGVVVENNLEGLILNINGKDLFSRLLGRFNGYNLLAVYSAASLLGLDEQEVLVALSGLNPVEGRFERIRSEEGVIGIIDYAHTPDALMNVLETINSIRTGNEKVITVIGAGGDRDSLKRPMMAKIAGSMSDVIILTADNPRTEDPLSIIDDMKKGIEAAVARKFITNPDRREAIKTASTLAKAGDIILVAGKGHEKYQEIKGKKLPFDDKETLIGFLNKSK